MTKRGRPMRRALLAASAGALAIPAAVGAQSMRTVTMSRQLEDNQPVRVAVEYASGNFSIGALDDGLLYRMSLSYDEDHFEPIAEYSNHRLHLGVDAIHGGVRYVYRFRLPWPSRTSPTPPATTSGPSWEVDQ